MRNPHQPKASAPQHIKVTHVTHAADLNAARSTTAEAQRLRILEALKSGPKTSYYLRGIGCYQCPTRILELRRRGHEIETARVNVLDAEGYFHPRVALYTLVKPRAGKTAPGSEAGHA